MKKFNLESLGLEVMDAQELEQATGGLNAAFSAGLSAQACVNLLGLVGVNVGASASAGGSVSLPIL